MTAKKNWQPETIAAQLGCRREEGNWVPTVQPIQPAASYYYRSMAELDQVFMDNESGYCYSRYGNPTVSAFEEAVAELEGGEGAIGFGSGMAAIHAAFLAAGARQGSSIVAAQDVYGATYALLDKLMRSQGVNVHFVDVTDLASVERTLKKVKPVLLHVETVSNPLLKVADIKRLGELAHASGARFIVDNTFATPCLVQPLKLGADYVMHSATKYLGGHGDVLGGVVVTSQEKKREMFETQKVTGGNLGPFEAWLLIRGMKTLPLRIHAQCKNALEVASWLEAHKKVSRVYYPGLKSHPQHELAKRLLGGVEFGAMVSFDLAEAGQAEVFRFFDALKLCLPATTLGDIMSLVLYPPHSSHRALSAEARAQIGISEGLVRLSVGIEAVGDITGDLDRAMNEALP